MTSIPQETLDAYFAAWNERNDVARKRLVEKAWAEEGEYEEAGVALTGRQAIDDHIGAVLDASPQRRLAIDRVLEGRGGGTAFTWTLSLPQGKPKCGYAAGAVDGNGRLQTVKSWEDDRSPDQRPKSIVSRLRSWPLSTWLQALGLAAVGTYVLLRVPAEWFYSEFEVTPEDAGFGEVNFVLRQYANVILYFVMLGLAWAALYLVGMYSGVVVSYMRSQQGRPGRLWEAGLGFAASIAGMLLAIDGLEKEDPFRLVAGLLLLAGAVALPWLPRNAEVVRRDAHRMFLRWAAFVAIFGALAYGTFVYIVEAFSNASSDANDVKAGLVPGNTLVPVPWRPRRVEVAWTSETPPVDLPDCSQLTFLGENDKRVIVYDGRADRTIRLSHGDVELIFPDNCSK